MSGKSDVDRRWQRGGSRDRLLDATWRAIATEGPSAVAGRSIARDAEVHHAQIQQMFGTVGRLVTEAVLRARDRYMADVFDSTGPLPAPLALGDHPQFWRAITQVVLDPGPVDLQVVADGGPVVELASRLAQQSPKRDVDRCVLIAYVWAAAPLGALVFETPLRRGLGIGRDYWPRCWERLGSRLQDLAAGAELGDLVEVPQLAVVAPPNNPPPTHRRDKLVLAAEELLATRLEGGVRGRELAAHAGVNYGLVNHHFGSKSAVFDEALVGLHRRFLAEVLVASESPNPAWVHLVFLRHRPFIRAWASRLLGDGAVPDFKLLGMERLARDVAMARGVESADDPARIEAIGDAMSAVALQLGSALLHPLLAAASGSERPADSTISRLPAVHRWLLANQA